MSVPLMRDGNVVLDLGGNGQVTLGPNGESWDITATTVSVSTRVREAEAKIYLNYVGDQYYLGGTYSGSSGDTDDTPIHLNDGEKVVIVFTGGDAAAVGQVFVRGMKSSPVGGFRV